MSVESKKKEGEGKGKEKKVWHTWRCENPNCQDPNVANCFLCSKCLIKSYCSAKCLKEDKKVHDLCCKIIPEKYVKWVEEIRTAIANMQNDRDGCLAIHEDIKEKYKNNSDTKRRGTIVIDLAQQTIETDVVMPTLKKDLKKDLKKEERKLSSSSASAANQNPESVASALGSPSSLIRNKHSLVWHYVLSDNESFVKDPRYAKLNYLMENYDFEKSFVLLVICIDYETDECCFVESIVEL